MNHLKYFLFLKNSILKFDIIFDIITHKIKNIQNSAKGGDTRAAPVFLSHNVERTGRLYVLWRLPSYMSIL